MAEDDTALERMFRKRKKILMGMGLDKSRAVLKAIESIKYDTGIDLTERVKFNPLKSDDISETTAKLHTETQPAPCTQAPKNYRGCNLNKRGKNKNGETLFNLVRKVNGQKQQKYLGVWDQAKADQIIDEMNQ